MSLIDTNYDVYDNSEIKAFQDHRVNVSLVGQKDQDEKKIYSTDMNSIYEHLNV